MFLCLALLENVVLVSLAVYGGLDKYDGPWVFVFVDVLNLILGDKFQLSLLDNMLMLSIY